MIHWSCNIQTILDYLQRNVYVFKRKDLNLSFLPNKAFIFNYNDKSGVELEYRPRKKNNEQEWKTKYRQQQYIWRETKIIKYFILAF